MALTLAQVDTAIEGIQENGQTFMLDGMQYSAANLSSLVELRKQMQQESSRSGGNRPLMRGFNFSNMGY